MTDKLKLTNDFAVSSLKLIETLEAFSILEEDVAFCRIVVKKYDSLFWRRCLIRTVFAAIEGHVYLLKRMAIQRHVVGRVTFSLGELSCLEEKDYKIEENGKVRDIARKISTLTDLRFAFAMFAKAFEFDNPVDYGTTDGWEAFRQLEKMRNRLAHPKTINDLDISSEDMIIFTNAYQWYASAIVKLWEVAGPIAVMEVAEAKDTLQHLLDQLKTGASVSKDEINTLLGR